MTCVIFLILAVFSLTRQADAAFVSYKDTSGKMHYINTDYTKVPDQYLSQVEDQLKKIEADKAKNNFVNFPGQNTNIPTPGWIPSDDQDQQPQNTNKIVEVFYKTNCEECMRLRVLLDANNIQYSLYDIENSFPGIEFYKMMQNAALPITRVAGAIIHGNDILAIKNALNLKMPAPKNPAPEQTPETMAVPTPNDPIVAPATNAYGGYKPGQYFKTKPLLGNK